MRLKVEIEWQGQPWRKRNQIQWLCIVDAIFGVLLAIIYIVKLAIPDLEPEFPAATPRERMNNSLALVFLVAANLIQTMHASRLYYFVTRNEGRNPKNCHVTAKTWFDFTEFSYLFTVVKCVATVGYIFKVAPHPWILALIVVTLPECVFKLYILYVVHGFMTDLRNSLKYLPKFRFLPIRCVSEDVLAQERDYGYKQEGDVNANTQLLV